MPTLQELTLAHSQRLSELYRTRDVALADAQATRDDQLRALEAATLIFEKYDGDVAEAREKQLAADAKAEAARTAALMTAVDQRADALEDAQMARRSADVDAVTTKRRMEDAAEAKYLAVLTRIRDVSDAQRAQSRQEAERVRRQELDHARRTHDEALVTSQQKYRAAVDEAVLRERRDGRDSQRAYLDALRLGDAATRAARASADQGLLAALTKLPEARDVIRAWRERLAQVGKETAEAEKAEFSRFRRELQTLKT